MTTNLQDIEITLTHQEQQINDLSDMVHKQWNEINKLRRTLDQTQRRLNELETSNAETTEQGELSSIEIAALDRPPHY